MFFSLQSSIKLSLENAEVTYNTSHVLASLRLTPKKQGKVMYTDGYTFLTLPRIWIRAQCYAGDQYQFLMIDRNVDLCLLLQKKSSSRFIQAFYSYVASFGQIPEQCPIRANQKFYVEKFPGPNGSGTIIKPPSSGGDGLFAKPYSILMSSNKLKARCNISAFDRPNFEAPVWGIVLWGRFMP